MLNLLLTIFFASFIGYIFYKLKIAGGLIIGALIGSALFNIITGNGAMPEGTKFITQALAGGIIGCSINKKDVIGIKYILKPIMLVMFMFLILNLVVGFVIFKTSSLDLSTALMSAVPGGISNIPIIAGDFGANPGKVATMQFARLIAGIAIFPSLINLIGNDININLNPPLENLSNENAEDKITFTNKNICITLIIACIGGFIGNALGISGGALLISMIFVIILKLKGAPMFLPNSIRRIAQIISGTFLGYTMTLNDILDLKTLLIPIIILVIAYFINCFITGMLLYKFFNFNLKEAMLATSPAGASDMALIAADMGIVSPRLAIIQICRLIIVVSIFPQIIGLLI